MKTECINVRGTVLKVLPQAFFKIKLDTVETEVLAYLAGKLCKRKVNPNIGDKVILEMSPTDHTRGRIVKLVS